MRRSPLHSFHVQAGARLVEFAGWEMPVYYSGITAEHVHTRTRVCLFDVSHMGRLRIEGTGAVDLLRRVCTRNLAETAVGQSKYSHICNEAGGILDDVIVSRHAEHWMVVCNASNREKIVGWLNAHAGDLDAGVTDVTFDTAMIALQGPETISFIESRVGLSFADLKRYQFVDGAVFGMRYTIYRSGYTGEDGVEAVLPAGAAPMLLPRLFGPDLDDFDSCKPAGLGARDTLRLEAGMPLYGHELSEKVDPISAGQGWCVDSKDDFIGAAAIRKVRQSGPEQKLVGLELEGKRVARQGYAILHDGRRVGEITSGTMSPTLSKSIAMGYVASELAAEGGSLVVDLGRKQCEAVVVSLPFYKRPRRS